MLVAIQKEVETFDPEVARRYYIGKLSPFVTMPNGKRGRIYDPDDIVADAWIKWTSKQEENKDKPIQYGIGICLHYAWRDYWRSEKRHTRKQYRKILRGMIGARDHRMMDYAINGLLHSLESLSVLTKTQQTVLTMLWVGWKPAGIARQLGISKPRVSAILARIREVARNVMETECKYPLPRYDAHPNKLGNDYASDKDFQANGNPLPKAYRVPMTRESYKAIRREKRNNAKLVAMCQARYGKLRPDTREASEPKTNCPLHIVHKVPQIIS
jgi:DNA-directed RNA polymerase specialized sigma24 family protein